MGKLFKTCDDITEMINDEFKKTNLESYGINLKIMSTKKAKEILKLSKASATTEFIIKRDYVIQICVYEAAFDRLPDNAKQLLIEMALSSIVYDVDKDKLSVDNNPYNPLFNARRKYDVKTVVDTMELGYTIISQIEEEEKAKKEEERLAKKQKK
jgi:hypothetical protein